MLNEFAGKGIDRAFQLLNRRRLNSRMAGVFPFETAPHLGRFALIASWVAGRELRVVDLKGDIRPRPYRQILNKMTHPALLPDYGFGWSDGETIFLPPSIAHMSAEKEQEKLAQVLLFFLSGQIRWGSLSLPAENASLFESDQPLADIYWIIENRRISSLVFSEFPGMLKLWKDVVSRLMNERPDRKILNKIENAVEELLAENVNISEGEVPGSASVAQSFSLSLAIKSRWLEEGLCERRYRGMVPFAPWGRLLPGRIRDGTLKQGEEGMVKKGDEGPIKSSGEEGKRARYITKKENIDEESSDQGLALNIFDKLMSWARFVNVSRPFDDDPDEESSKKAEEMEELTTAQVKKSTNATLDAELEKEELLLEEPEGDTKPGEGMFVYREWDYRSRTYKENYSIGFESVAEELKGDFVKEVLKEKRGLIKEVKRKFESVTSSVRVEKRQFDGDSIDIDAAVEAMTDLKMGRQPDERLFTFHKRSERDISALFLVDLSMSTDTWVKEKRVIDHEKEALVVLCEAMQSLRERYAIYGFSGQTRKRCSFIKIKGLDESYGETVRRRIEGLIPYHYTRMGPALRHSTSILKCESSDVKLLFLLSDGKPNDLDSYEGKYGIEDTRMAIREAEREGIVPFCLTVDSQAGEYLPTLFGRGNYALLSGVERLATRLPELYARIVRQL
jgi:nitric oxide reductase NorD protein